MIFEFESRVRYSEVDERAYLTPAALVNYFQDVCALQGEARGVGVGYLAQHHIAWMLSSWQIEIARMPRLAEKVTAQTWAYDFQAFYGMRNFVLRDGAGELCARANSYWALIDTQTQRPIRVDGRMLEAYPLSEKLDMDYAPRKLPEPADGREEEPFPIMRHHLDTNRHVNNEQYIAMALLYAPADFRIRTIRAEYRRQAHLGDTICPYVHEEAGKLTVSLRNEESRPYAVVELAGDCGAGGGAGEA